MKTNPLRPAALLVAVLTFAVATTPNAVAMKQIQLTSTAYETYDAVVGTVWGAPDTVHEVNEEFNEWFENLYYGIMDGVDDQGLVDGVVEDPVGAVTDLDPGGVTVYSCMAWLCAYASAHQDEEHNLPGDNPVTKMTAGGAISQLRLAGRAEISTTLGGTTCYYDPNSAQNPSTGCGHTWSEVDFNCSSRFFAESRAFDFVLYTGTAPAHAEDPLCN